MKLQKDLTPATLHIVPRPFYCWRGFGIAWLKWVWIFTLSGCATFNVPYTVPPQVKYACTFVHWIEESDIQSFCPPNAKACATVGTVGLVNHIWTTKPQAFDDRDAVYRLGHEFLHTLGARHK